MTPSTDTASPAPSDLTLGVQRYLDFLQRQANLTLATATSWAVAMTTMPVAVAGQLKAAEQLVNTSTEHLAAQARAAADMTRKVAEQIVLAEQDAVRSGFHLPVDDTTGTETSSAQHFSPGPAGAADRPKALLTNIFEDIVELVVDADIMAYSR